VQRTKRGIWKAVGALLAPGDSGSSRSHCQIGSGVGNAYATALPDGTFVSHFIFVTRKGLSQSILTIP